MVLSPLRDIFEAPSLSFAYVAKTPGIHLNVVYREEIIGTLALSFAPRTPSLSFDSTTFSVDILMSDIVSDSTW